MYVTGSPTRTRRGWVVRDPPPHAVPLTRFTWACHEQLTV